VPCRFAPLQDIRVRHQLVTIDATLGRQPVDCRTHQRPGVGGGRGDIKLGAVAGGQECRFWRGVDQGRVQGPQRAGHLVGCKGKALAQLDRGRAVVESHRDHAHGVEL
jgi:hypothetical protein